MTVRLLADALCRIEDVKRDIDDHGWRDRKTGDPRPVVDLERRLGREAFDYAEAIGLSPRGRLKLGLDVQRGFDLAKHWAEGGER